MRCLTLRAGLAASSQAHPSRRVALPLIESGGLPAPSEELTPERIAQFLEDEDAERALG